MSISEVGGAQLEMVGLDSKQELTSKTSWIWWYFTHSTLKVTVLAPSTSNYVRFFLILTSDGQVKLVTMNFFEIWGWPMSWAKWHPSQVGHPQVWRSSFNDDQLEMVAISPQENQKRWTSSTCWSPFRIGKHSYTSVIWSTFNTINNKNASCGGHTPSKTPVSKT